MPKERARPEESRYSKHIVCALKILKLLQNPQSTKELAKKTNMHRMQVDRILKEFEAFGFARNVEGKWCRTEQPSDFERTMLLDHFIKLKPGFEELLSEVKGLPFQTDEPNQTIDKTLKEAVEEHLKSGYPELFELLKEYRNLIQELEGSAMGRIQQHFGMAKFHTAEQTWFSQYQASGSGLIGKVLHPKRLMKIEVPYSYEFRNVEEALQALKAVKGGSPQLYTDKDGRCFVCGPLTIDDDYGKAEKEFALSMEISKALVDIVVRIKHNQSLKGQCNLCPNRQ